MFFLTDIEKEVIFESIFGFLDFWNDPNVWIMLTNRRMLKFEQSNQSFIEESRNYHLRKATAVGGGIEELKAKPIDGRPNRINRTIESIESIESIQKVNNGLSFVSYWRLTAGLRL